MKTERQTHQQRVEKSRRLMLDSAAEMILELGTAATTLSAVGERAGYSRGLAQARFGDKESMFLQLSERCKWIWIQQLRSSQGNKVGVDALLSRIDAIESFVTRDRDHARVLYILWFESVGSISTMRDGLKNFHRNAREDISTLIVQAKGLNEVEKEFDENTYATQFCATFFGLCYQWLVADEDIAISDQINVFKSQVKQQLG